MGSVEPCKHNTSQITANVTRLTDNPDKPEDGTVVGWVADITLTCTDCGKPFGFRTAVVGVDPTQPATDPSGKELRVPLLSPEQLEELGPLAALHLPEPQTPGFKIGRKAS